MDTITVPKDDLIRTLRENRDAHLEIFEKAQVVYREQMIAELDRALEEAKNGGKIRRGFSLPVPEDHTEDFDTAIQMLEWDKNNTVVLSTREFRMYVQNEWGWQAAFAANTMSYSAMLDEAEEIARND